MTRLIVGPFNRVEGDLEVQLDIANGRVTSARVNAPMYRGFEQMLVGREPHDALVIVPRICGICSVSQSVAAARALADASGVELPPNGVHVINLMLACENLADHLSHFYLFFMPDFTRPVYADRPWFREATRRFAALAGEHGRAAVAARQRWFEIMGTLGGKWPHTLSMSAMALSIFVGSEFEKETLVSWAKLVDEGEKFGIPVLAVTAVGKDMARDVRYLGLSCRIAAEMGAHIVKTYHCDNFEELIGSCPIPVIVAGGKKTPEMEALELTYNAVKGGAVGFDMGRNIFQSDSPVGMIKAVRAIVHENVSVKEAFKIYESEKGSKARKAS